MQKWPIPRFRNILIFYVPEDDGVRIVRVLHGAQDWFTEFNVP